MRADRDSYDDLLGRKMAERDEWHRRAEAAEAEVRRLTAELKLAREGLRDLLDNGGWGHSHWDSTGQHGAGCSTCIQQREAKERVRALLSASPSDGGGAK